MRKIQFKIINPEKPVDSNIGWTSFFTARLSRRIALWVFFSILVIESIILIPSVVNKQKELLLVLEQNIIYRLNAIESIQEFKNPVDLLPLLQKQKIPHLQGIIILNANGEVLSKHGKQLKRPANSLFSDEHVITYPIFGNHKAVLIFSTQKIREKIFLYIFNITILVAFISGFVVVSTLLILKYFVIVPILQLRNDLKDAGAVLKKETIDVVSFDSASYNKKDELKDVINTFQTLFFIARNQILQRRNAEKKLENLNQQLEQKIHERTFELENTNQKLKNEINEKSKIENLLRYNAYHDELTGLGNRSFFLDKLKGMLLESEKIQKIIVLVIDIDRFKILNDSFGHGVGDAVLIEMANRLLHIDRKNMLLARLSGDEFAIAICKISDEEQAIQIGKQIHKIIIDPFIIDKNEFFLTVSIGVAIDNGSYNKPEALLRDADLVMYRAKERGRARTEIFDSEMRKNVIYQMELETDLRKAIKQIDKPADEFQLYYQPIVSMQDGRIFGFEVLARWLHPQKGFISPIHFIPKAEETGLIIALGCYILQTACRQLANWIIKYTDASQLYLSVNLSGRQFRQENLPQMIEEILKDTGLQGQQLKLEITESSLVDEPELARDMLLRLKKRKIKLSMDDFGTGYSSLSYLHKFPFDTIKIDRSFILRWQQEGKEIIHTIITLAKAFGMDVVAEGIETEEQQQNLKELQCHYGQGYYFGRPLPAVEAEKWLKK